LRFFGTCTNSTQPSRGGIAHELLRRALVGKKSTISPSALVEADHLHVFHGGPFAILVLDLVRTGLRSSASYVAHPPAGKHWPVVIERKLIRPVQGRCGSRGCGTFGRTRPPAGSHVTYRPGIAAVFPARFDHGHHEVPNTVAGASFAESFAVSARF